MGRRRNVRRFLLMLANHRPLVSSDTNGPKLPLTLRILSVRFRHRVWLLKPKVNTLVNQIECCFREGKVCWSGNPISRP